ncbi:MAG: DUF4956 domain-containing protein [Saprospiraceae bacterium]
MQFEDFLSEFSTDVISHQQFLWHALICALLSWLLGRFYMRYGRAVANRKNFGHNFMLLALSTMLIIYIVKSSIALSLGLVGALSIVRFRAAIKEPEELIYLFFTIGIGIGIGANQLTITVLAYILIMSLLVIHAMLSKKASILAPENMILTISTTTLSVQDINAILASFFATVELKRMDELNGRLDLSYIIASDKVDQVIAAKDQLISKAPGLQFSFIEQRNLAL